MKENSRYRVGKRIAWRKLEQCRESRWKDKGRFGFYMWVLPWQKAAEETQGDCVRVQSSDS